MMNRAKYNQILGNVSLAFQELYSIVEAIKNDFEEENRQDPGLTITVVTHHLNIVKKYRDAFQDRIDNPEDGAYQSWTLDRMIKSSSQKISSFHREFDNPFLCSERWYQRIVALQRRLLEQAKMLDQLSLDGQ